MKRRAWKWALGVAAVLALAIGGLLWSAHTRATAVFQRHDALVKDSIAALHARSSDPPRLFDPERPGNGWSAFRKALDAVAAIPDADAEEIPAIKQEPDFKPDLEKLEAVFQKHEPVVEALREAARYREFRPEYLSEESNWAQLLDLNRMLRSMRFLSGRATHAHERRRGAEAAESILLGLDLAQRVGRDGPTVCYHMQRISEGILADALREILPSHAFQEADLESFAAKLDVLRRVRQGGADVIAVENVLVQRSLVNAGIYGTTDESIKDLPIDRSWRYLFSRRLMYADALGEFDRYFQDAGRAALLPSARRFEALDEIAARAAESRNPLMRGSSYLSRTIGRVDLDALVEWTLMRVAVALAWYQTERGASPAKLEDLVPRYLRELPSCPLTSRPLLYLDGRVWSVGRNGVDDGGSPGMSGDVSDKQGDVVWTVKRK